MSKTVWPRTYLLSIYERAVTVGACKVTQLTEEQGKSLRAALNRLKRNDVRMSPYIPQEYMLVTVSHWHVLPGETLGCLDVVFSQPVEGFTLPPIVDVDGTDQYISPPSPNFSEPTPIAPHELTITPDEVPNFVEGLKKRAKQKD